MLLVAIEAPLQANTELRPPTWGIAVHPQGFEWLARSNLLELVLHLRDLDIEPYCMANLEVER